MTASCRAPVLRGRGTQHTVLAAQDEAAIQQRDVGRRRGQGHCAAEVGQHDPATTEGRVERPSRRLRPASPGHEQDRRGRTERQRLDEALRINQPLATAYYLAKLHGMTNIAVLEKGWLGGGNTARNTTIIRSNYLLPANTAFYEHSLKLWEGLERDINFNAMVSQRGVLNLYHSDAQRDAYARRGNAMRIAGVDAELLGREEVRAMVPHLDFDNARFPIKGGLLQPRGGTVRHDAVAWGYARAASALGVDIIQNCPVTGLVVQGGRVMGVETARGPIRAATSSTTSSTVGGTISSTATSARPSHQPARFTVRISALDAVSESHGWAIASVHSAKSWRNHRHQSPHLFGPAAVMRPQATCGSARSRRGPPDRSGGPRRAR